MLWLPNPSTFQYTLDNFNDSYADGGTFGTQCTSGSANAKAASATEIMADLAEDCYGIAFCFNSGFTSNNRRSFLVDIGIDPAGGTSYSTIIANLVACGPALAMGGYWYYFPLFIKAGSAIAATVQCNNASTNVRVGCKVWGRPSNPQELKYGTFVKTFGAVTGSTEGTALTPGTQAKGSFSASLGTTANDLWWWQGGLTFNDTSLAGGIAYALDISAGDGTTKLACAHDIWHRTSSTEQVGKDAFGIRPPVRPMASGAAVYIRAAASGTPDSSATGVVYALGG